MARGHCPRTPTWTYAPRTLRSSTCVLKKWPHSQPFFAARTPQSVINLHRLFNMSIIQTHILTYFWKIKAGVGVIYFLVCVGKHDSNLPTNSRTKVGKKTQWCVEKCDLLSETTFEFLPYFMTAWCVILPNCVFFTNGVNFLSCFSSQHYVSMIFGKQC